MLSSTVYDLRHVLGQHFDFLSRAPKHFTRAACGRLFLADVLPSAIKRVIYLDSDTLALGDISELWSITRETPVMAACRVNEDMRTYKNQIGMDATAPYFNSGVLGINLSAWRHREIGPALLEIAKKMPRSLFLDQDVINVMLANQITELPAIWNVPANGAPTIEDVRIIHFSGPVKPWQFRYDGLGTTLFRNAKRASPGRYMLPELGFRRIVRRLQRSLAKRPPLTSPLDRVKTGPLRHMTRTPWAHRRFLSGRCPARSMRMSDDFDWNRLGNNEKIVN